MPRIPQFELNFPAEPFRLVAETAIDYDRVQREQEQAERDREMSSSRQSALAFVGQTAIVK